MCVISRPEAERLLLEARRAEIAARAGRELNVEFVLPCATRKTATISARPSTVFADMFRQRASETAGAAALVTITTGDWGIVRYSAVLGTRRRRAMRICA